MKYILSKNKWVDDFGIGIESALSPTDSYEPSEFMFPQEPTGQILAYVNDEFDCSLFADFSAVEISQSEALSFAKQVDKDAYISNDQTIEMPYKVI
jgi:hypothetical protein